MLGQGWQSQWRRVQTGLKQVQAVYAGRDGGTDDALDAVLSFFQAVHHLKDWLGNDPLSGVSKADGDALINGRPMLQLCADLANGSKHLVLTSAWTGDPSTAITRNDVNIFVGTGTVAHGFYVQSAGNEYDVLQIARTAVDEWASFLTSRGLQ
jgi:hypothetical protein